MSVESTFKMRIVATNTNKLCGIQNKKITVLGLIWEKRVWLIVPRKMQQSKRGNSVSSVPKDRIGPLWTVGHRPGNETQFLVKKLPHFFIGDRVLDEKCNFIARPVTPIILIREECDVFGA